jgi:hypothetical protein
VALGAAAGQTVIGDSTTVLIYKLARAAVRPAPGTPAIVLDTDNFPTDRYVLEGIAAERGLELVWIETDPVTGIHPAQVAEVVDERDGGRAVQPCRLSIRVACRRTGDHQHRALGRRAWPCGTCAIPSDPCRFFWTSGMSISRSAARTST